MAFANSSTFFFINVYFIYRVQCLSRIISDYAHSPYKWALYIRLQQRSVPLMHFYINLFLLHLKRCDSPSLSVLCGTWFLVPEMVA
jgi:hypothetical protein